MPEHLAFSLANVELFEALEVAFRAVGKTWCWLPEASNAKISKLENVHGLGFMYVAVAGKSPNVDSPEALVLLRLNGFETWRDLYHWLLAAFRRHVESLPPTCPHSFLFFVTTIHSVPSICCHVCMRPFATGDDHHLTYYMVNGKMEVRGQRGYIGHHDVIPPAYEWVLVSHVCETCVAELRTYVESLPALEWEECIPLLSLPMVLAKLVAQYAYERGRKACARCSGAQDVPGNILSGVAPYIVAEKKAMGSLLQ